MVRIAGGDGFSVKRVRTRADDGSWFEPTVGERHRLVLVRRGVFRARVGGGVVVADPAMAYLEAPGEERSIAHRAGVEDVCTVIECAGGFGREAGSFPVSGQAAVAHRLLAARAREAEPFELAEMVARLVGGVLEAAGKARSWLVESAREALADDLGATLPEVARRVGCSPYHLSRVFHRETGTTLAAYRRRLRVLRALDELEAGAPDLARLAAELGFADHAHLTRTVRGECGAPPAELRKKLQAAVRAEGEDSGA